MIAPLRPGDALQRGSLIWVAASGVVIRELVAWEAKHSRQYMPNECGRSWTLFVRGAAAEYA